MINDLIEMNKRCILKGISHEIGWLVFGDGIFLINYHNIIYQISDNTLLQATNGTKGRYSGYLYKATKQSINQSIKQSIINYHSINYQILFKNGDEKIINSI